MLNDPEQMSDFVRTDPTCRRLADLAAAHGRELALVGGWVRDRLLGRTSPDWDLVVTGDPKPLVKALVAGQGGGPFVPLDEGFGIYRTRLKGGLELDFAQAVGGSVMADLARRDLTINAMAVDLATGDFLDPLGGLADLRAGVVRAPSRANLEDDPLRLVRIYRFAAVLGFAVDPATAAWAAALTPRIAEPAGERVLQELAKLLPSGRAAAVMEAMRDLLPGMLGTAADPAPLAALEARLGEPGWARAAAWARQPLTGDRPGLVALMLCAMVADVEPVKRRLKWGKQEDKLARVWAGPKPAWPADPRGLHRLLRATGEALPGLALLDGGEPARAALDAWAFLQDHPRPKLTDGNDLMAALGLKPGKLVADLLAAIDEAQALGEIATRDEAIALASRGI